MEHLAALWMPILLSAVICFIASSIIWMASPLHKHDYKDPGDKEKPILEFLRANSLSAGVYYVPWCQGKDRKDPAVQAQMKQGPWAMLTVMPGMPSMGPMLGLWFVHLVIVSTFIAYLATHALHGGVTYLQVFQVVGTAGLLAYAGQAMPMCIWMGMPWSTLPGKLVDGLIYALLTAGTFGWLWPKAAAVIPTLPK